MSIIFKDLTQLLAESSLIDIVDDDIEIKELLDELEDIDELDYSDMGSTEEMIPIFTESTEYGTRYMIECSYLYGYAKSNNVDEITALEHICEFHNISLNSTYVIVESLDDMINSVNEAKSSKNKKMLNKASKAIKKFKDKGINLLRKKNK